MDPYMSGFLIFLIVALYFGAFLCLLKNKSLNLNEESLDKQPLFWFAVLSPIILFLIFGLVIWKDYIPDLSKDGLDKFAEISKFPLAVLALSPIFGVIVTNIHKTIQTSTEIRNSANDNKVNLFFKHRDWFVDEINKINNKNKFTNIENPLVLYKKIYPHSSYRDGFNSKIKEGLIASLTNELIEADFKLSEFNRVVNYFYFEMSSEDFGNLNKCAYDIQNSINYIDFYLVDNYLLENIESFFITVQDDSDFDPYIHGKDVIYEKYNLINDKMGSYQSFFSECILVIDGLVKIIEFDELNHDVSNEVKKYLNSFKGNVTILNEYIIEYRKLDPIEYYGNDFKDEKIK